MKKMKNTMKKLKDPMLEILKIDENLMKTQRKTKTHAQKLKTTQWNSNLAQEFGRKTQKP